MNLTPNQRAVLEFCPHSEVNAGANANHIDESTNVSHADAAEALWWLEDNDYVEYVGGGLFRRTAKGDEEVGK